MNEYIIKTDESGYVRLDSPLTKKQILREIPNMRDIWELKR